VPLRIAFDIDGVLADMDGSLTRRAEALFGQQSVLRTSGQQRRLWTQVEAHHNFWETLEETEPGIVRRLADVSRERHWEILFLTKRPPTAGLTAQLQTQRWLESKGFALPSVYVVRGSRGRIAAALQLDFVVDDRPENCLDVVVDSKARAILIWRDDAASVPTAARRLGIQVFETVDACVNALGQEGEGGSVVTRIAGRFRRLLGLKQEAGA
jgi:hypothetical protein